MTAFALSSVVLFLKMFAVALVQGHHRLKHNAFAIPEDAAYWAPGHDVQAQELPQVQRASAVLRNDLENIPIFLFLSLAYALIHCWPPGAWMYGAVFVASRIMHSIAYLKSIQPLRNRMYILGALAMFIMSGHIVVTALKQL